MAGYDIQRHNDFIRTRGETVDHWVGQRCPCVSDDARPRIDCPMCKGIGRYWADCQEIRGLVTAVHLHKDLMTVGLLVPGDMVFSPEIGIRPVAEYDMIRLEWTEGQSYEGDIIARGEPDEKDTLNYICTQVVGVSAIDYDEDSGKETIITYREGTDFIVDGREIEWLAGGNAPEKGQKYSVKYRAQFEWIVLYPPQDRLEHGQDIGSRVMLRKRHIVFPGAYHVVETG